MQLIFDIETNGLLDELNTIHSLVVKNFETGAVLSCGGSGATIEEGVALLEKASLLVGHNIIKFDLPAIRKVFPGFAPRGEVRDTILMARLFWPELAQQDTAARLRPFDGRPALPAHLSGRYSLESFGYRLGLHKGDYAKEAKDMGIDPWARWSPEMQRYCEQDVEVTEALYRRCLKQIGGAEGFSEASVILEHRVQEVIHLQEENGWRFDVDAGMALYSRLVQRLGEIEAELQEIFPPWFAAQPAKQTKRTRRMKLEGGHTAEYTEGAVHTPFKHVSFNPNSRDHIADRLIKLRGWQPMLFGMDGKPTLNEEVLSSLPWPEAKLISEFLMIKKRLGQLGDGSVAWLKKVKRDGRIYGRVTTNGAVTGRMTHSGPNMSQVPSVRAPYGRECRELFLPREGWVLVGCDADGIEGRCLAGYMAPLDGGAYIETILRGNKADGTDLHSANARAIGLDPEADYPVFGVVMSGREIAKTFFYAFLYGAGDAKLGQILGLDKAAGKKARAKLLDGFPALKQLVAAVASKAKKTGRLKGLDGRNIYVRSGHAALNTLLQGAGAVIMKQALVILYDDLTTLGLEHGKDYAFVGNIHDEIQLECPKENGQILGEVAAAAIRKAGEHFNFPCPQAGTFKIGRNWAETH